MERNTLPEERDLIEDLYSLFSDVIENDTNLLVVNSRSWIKNWVSTEIDIVVPEWEENPDLDSPLIGIDIGVRGYQSDPQMSFQLNWVRRRVVN